MADEQQLALLMREVTAWNEWRISNPSVKVDLTGADLISADLTSADLSGANLTDSQLSHARLTYASLHGARLRRADLMSADLKRANLMSTDLTNARLNSANLIGARLRRANLRAADLTAADLSHASLTHSNLTDANLTHSNLTDANLSQATLTHAQLTGAQLNSARFEETLLGDVNLSQVKGLDKVLHGGPSSLDHRTLLQSGPLPLVFLRGCGLPDRLIDYLPSVLNAAPIQFFSCFISYSTANQDFADRLHADLQARGVRCWFAPHDMQPGRKIHDQIDEAIRIYDRLLLILSTESMSSLWVKTEIAKARKKEVASQRRVLFPIALVPFSDIRAWEQFNADLGEDSAREIREYFVPDFSDWKTDHDAYQRSFERVIAALQSADDDVVGV